MIGPWNFYSLDFKKISDRVIKEISRSSLSLKAAVCLLEDVELVLLQPENEYTLFSDFIKKFGQGIFCLSFKVYDYQNSIESARDTGIEIIQSLDLNGKNISFLDTTKDLKFVSCISDSSPILEGLKSYDTYPK